MKKILILISAVALCVAARADSVAVTNAEAMRLFVAMRSTQAGLSAVHATRLAQNINVLRGYVEAFEAKQSQLAVEASKLPNNAEGATAAAKINAEARALAVDKFSVELRTVALTDDEIAAAKVPPDALAEFLRFLAPAEPKKK
jgi:hypothetical protein